MTTSFTTHRGVYNFVGPRHLSLRPRKPQPIGGQGALAYGTLT